MRLISRKWVWTLVTLFWRNWLTSLGSILATFSALSIIAFVALGFLGLDTPYLGVMAFLVMPALFIVGLFLIPIGLHYDRKKRATRQDEPELYPVFDFNQPRLRRMAGVVAVLTAINLMILSFVSYQGVVFMDSVAFCGTTCHTVMEPEYTTYLNSPHSKVKCVECHIGAGAPWFVRSKLSGVGQVLAVAFNTYSRPVPSPVENLRPARDTCEQCHWPERFTGNRIKVITKFAEDESNTETKTVLLLHIGGGATGQGGIHSWHIDPKKETTYITTDPRREVIPWIHVREADGTVHEFVAREGAPTAEQLAKGQKRTMDCIDCHNRPTHIFKLPDQAMDESLAAGRIDRSLPYIKKVGVEALKQATGPKQEALEKIARRVRDHFQQNYPELVISKKPAIEAAIEEIQAIYRRNVFPSMNVTWGTHPDHIGHERFPGCFRCHDDQHVSKTGKTISQDCSLCHTILAQDEQDPEVLKQLEIK